MSDDSELERATMDTALARHPEQRRRGDGMNMLAQTRMLYVEDDAEVREQLAQFLRRRVRQLIVAADGHEGIEAFRRLRPDIVITDVCMSRLDGLSMVREMKAQDASVPIVVTSAFSEPRYLLEAIELGVDRYVLKPLNTQRLLEALEACSRIAHAERGLRLSQAIIDSASEAVVVLDALDRIASANPAFRALTGHDAERVQGQSLSLLLSDADSAAIPRHDGATQRWRGELGMRRADGSTFHAMCSVDPVFAPDGTVQHRVLMFYDVTEARQAREQMQQLAYYDPLTGLANRRLFDEQLQRALHKAEAKGAQLGLLFVDLDRFKQVNDTHGHAIGDLLLREIGQRLRDTVRDQDLVSRRSGDELVILLREIGSADEVAAVARRVRAAVRLPLDLEGCVIQVTCTVGTAVYPRDGTDPTALLRHADREMYREKNQNRSGDRDR